MRVISVLFLGVAAYVLQSNLGAIPDVTAPEGDVNITDVRTIAVEPAVVSQRRLAEEDMRAGDPAGAANRLLAALRDVSLDDPCALDEAHATFQCLSFTLCSLLNDAQLIDFLNSTLDPVHYPVDALVEVHFYREFAEYTRVRPDIAIPDESQVREELRQLADSPYPLVQAGALAMLADPGWKGMRPEEYGELVASMNRLADLCPDAMVTRSAFYKMIRVCAGKAFDHPEAVKALLALGDWNESVQILIATDPLVQVASDAVQQAEATAMMKSAQPTPLEAGTSVLRQTSIDHDDPLVRDGCVRLLASTNSLSGDHPTVLAPEIKETCYTVAERPGVLVADGAVERVPVDTARAEYTLLANAIEDGDLTAAAPLVEALSGQERESEPFDVNLFERVPRKINFYALELVKQGRHDDAIAVYEQLCQAYPNSWFAAEWQEHIDHLRSLRR